ncbi:uncharacterized protein Gasu_15000 [Galdieria sulphuraria]|uniref:Uncharacterized protein n=1 Tax=Galdieria sulphuraria TaxID=130081 RepID=M2X4A4_GALSU|nr:uncharacterized protein Gasu_15000 [Galdieria sulphuraria]EME31260.1 hypothetical protein Gasu_15000 [Galdieria sulphuraria]|eukprot:XP_005707780.1 hypothetical protein Gasu_15000 [Galdieria sulphuraria]
MDETFSNILAYRIELTSQIILIDLMKWLKTCEKPWPQILSRAITFFPAFKKRNRADPFVELSLVCLLF